MLRDVLEGFDGGFEVGGCGGDVGEGSLGFGRVVDVRGELDLHKGYVEFEVDLFGCYFESLYSLDIGE